jgi:hypothetical protein
MKPSRTEKLQDAAHRWMRTASETLALLTGWAGILAAAGVTAYQGFVWLRAGSWPPFRTGDLISVPPTFLAEWIGARQLLDWALDTPVQALFILGGIAAALIFLRLAVFLDPPAAK